MLYYWFKQKILCQYKVSMTGTPEINENYGNLQQIRSNEDCRH